MPPGEAEAGGCAEAGADRGAAVMFGHGKIVLRRERCCVGIGDHRCLRPRARPGGYCVACWQSLSPERRAVLAWEDAFEAPAYDPVAEAEAILARAP